MDEPTNQPASQPPAQGMNAGAAPTSGDADQHKAFAIIGYILPFLFFIPMLSESGKKSAFAMFHANQQLLLFITWIVAWVTTFVLIGFLIYIFAFILMIIGIVNAAGGHMKKLPLIGGITILK